MKKLLMMLALAASAVAWAANSDFEKSADASDPAAPFENYGPAMVSTDEKPLLADWQEKHAEKLAQETDPAVLAAFVRDDASARALLNRLGPAYATDPVVATQIAAVTQWVLCPDPCWLCFWKDFPSRGRRVWVEALLNTAETNANAYIRQQCLEQLRWCAPNCPCVVDRIRALAQGDPDKGVKDLAALALAGIGAAE